MDIATLVERMMSDGTVQRVARNPRAQFGTAARRYIGAEILPERLTMENSYTEEAVRYRTIVANAGSRYGPVQLKKGELVGTFEVKLAESDIGRELTSRDYDALIRLLGRNLSMDATAAVIRFADTLLNLALVEILERWRWQAIVNAQVVLSGDNEYLENVAYSNPAGHRVNVAGDWDTDTYDPFDDIFAMADMFASKGFTLSRIITSRKVVSKMAGNDKVKTRTNRVTVNTSGQITSVGGRPALSDINAALNADGLPSIEIYDLQYRTQTGTGRFLADTVMVLIAETGRDETLDLGDSVQEQLVNTLGYTGVGRAAGQDTPGRVIRLESFRNKPPRIEGEAWQTGLPVILEPEAIAVLQNIV